MWTLINVLQFFVYLGMWQIQYPRLSALILKEFRRIANGEIIDDLDFAFGIKESFGLSASEKDPTKEGVGDERLTQGSISENIGLTLILITILLIVLIFLILVAIKLAKMYKFSPKW